MQEGRRILLTKQTKTSKLIINALRSILDIFRKMFAFMKKDITFALPFWKRLYTITDKQIEKYFQQTEN